MTCGCGWNNECWFLYFTFRFIGCYSDITCWCYAFVGCEIIYQWRPQIAMSVEGMWCQKSCHFSQQILRIHIHAIHYIFHSFIPESHGLFISLQFVHYCQVFSPCKDLLQTSLSRHDEGCLSKQQDYVHTLSVCIAQHAQSHPLEVHHLLYRQTHLFDYNLLFITAHLCYIYLPHAHPYIFSRDFHFSNCNSSLVPVQMLFIVFPGLGQSLVLFSYICSPIIKDNLQQFSVSNWISVLLCIASSLLQIDWYL